MQPTPAFLTGAAFTPMAAAPTPAASSSFDHYAFGTPAASAQTPSAGFDYRPSEGMYKIPLRRASSDLDTRNRLRRWSTFLA